MECHSVDVEGEAAPAVSPARADDGMIGELAGTPVGGTGDPDEIAGEPELIARISSGEADLYGVLVDRYQRRLYWSCVRLLDDPDEAEDVVQETFVRAYERLADYDPAFRFHAWIYTIARNRCLNLLRRRKTWGFLSISHDPEGPAIASPESADAEVESNELATVLEECRRSLPPDHREVFDLRHADELTYAEIATALGVPQGTVMSRLARAREKMRRCLDVKGVTWR